MAAPDRYVVFGNPVEHSKSPTIHTAFAEQIGERIVYEKFMSPLGGFSKVVADFFASGGRGANVTVPFKIEAHNLSSIRSSRVRYAGAANTLTFTNGTIAADNTDGVGLIRDIRRNLDFKLKGKTILLVGAGGATRGVLVPILEECPSHIKIINRTESKARDLVASLGDRGRSEGVGLSSGGLSDLSGSAFDLVVNATSTSLDGEDFPVSSDILQPGALAYDMMYGKSDTAFFRWAEKAQADTVSDGLGMLVEQAAESFFIWRGKRPDTGPVIDLLRK